MGRGIATLALLGCLGKNQGFPLLTAPDVAIGTLVATPRNAIVALGGTTQLGLNAFSLTGTPMTTFDSVAYRLATPGDSGSVRVSNTGVVTGVRATSASIPVNVVAFNSGTWNGDQVLVTVTPTAVSGLTLSIQPPAGDSAKLASGTAKTLTPVLRNPMTGESVTGVGIQYAVRSQDLFRVGVYMGSVFIRPGVISTTPTVVHTAFSPAAARNQIIPYVSEGTAWIYAIINAYGTLLQDSVLYTFSYPYTGSIRILKSNLAVLTSLNAGTATAASENPGITLASGATITFTNGIAATDPLAVAFTFDNPAAATVATPPSSVGGTFGNVTLLTGGQNATRQFLTPGTYHWTWTANGGPAPWSGQAASGIIVIK